MEKYTNMKNQIILGDCLEVMKTLPENSVDSIVTDPPYELGFMGKSWDNTGIANSKEMWAEALRVLKPGGHLLSFGGTRTYHRMACAIEDAGFEVRDMISWIYGSGFPKSLNIGKAVDKLRGGERVVVDSYRTGEGANFKHSGSGVEQLHEAEAKEIDVTKGTSEWEGWGTALKPACEPCVLARKPLSEKTVALNVLKWGTGGINIDGSRVSHNEETKTANRQQRSAGWNPDNCGFDSTNNTVASAAPEGRFPANIIHDGSDEVVSLFPNTKVGARKAGQLRHTKDGDLNFTGNTYTIKDYPASGGNASRFFYCAKASKSERNKGCEELEEINIDYEGRRGQNNSPIRPDGIERKENVSKNNHPTVKPQSLMKYLITLITPKGGTILDPFAGSGSTLVAAKDLGFNYIGIEMTEEYIPIIEARLK